MKKILVQISLCITLLSSCTERERIIPTKPFIVVDTEPFQYCITKDGVRYKVIDKNGYVFYFSEMVEFREYPRYSLGDTIK